jgi:hypothetical protein
LVSVSIYIYVWINEWIHLNGRAASCIAWLQIHFFIIICFSLNICGDDNNIFTHRKSFFSCYTSFRSMSVLVMT